MLNKGKAVGMLFLGCVLGQEAAGQPVDEEDALMLNPDDFTAVLLNENIQDIEENIKFLDYQQEDKVAYQDSPVIDGRSLVDDGILREVLLSESDKIGQGAMFYFGILESQMNALGEGNVARLAANKYFLSDEESQGFVLFVKDINQAYSARLSSIKSENCAMFNDELKTLGEGQALENMASRENTLDEFAYAYYYDVLSELDTAFNDTFAEEVQDEINVISGGVKSYAADRLDVYAANNLDSLEVYKEKCR